MKSVCFAFTLFFFCKISFSQDLDYNYLKSINTGTMPVWDNAMKGISFSIYPVMPASVISIWTHGYFKKDKELMRSAYKGVICIGSAVAISTALKYLVNRPRPFITYPNDIIKRENAGFASFPSGHSTGAFATATVLSLTYKKWYVCVPSFLYAGMVAYSRMRLGVHYPSDVLGGAILGIGTGLLTWKIDKIMRKKKESPVIIE